MPRDPAERVRLYYEIKDLPIPPDVIAATGRMAYEPDATPTAKRLIQRFGLDATHIKGSSSRGRIGVKDVKEHLEKHLAGMAETVGGEGLAKMLVSAATEEK
jgi:hypothetical protein